MENKGEAGGTAARAGYLNVCEFSASSLSFSLHLDSGFTATAIMATTLSTFRPLSRSLAQRLCDSVSTKALYIFSMMERVTG
jgi:hypothetical protein